MKRDKRIQEITRFREKLGIPAVFGGVIGAHGNLELDVVGVRRQGYPEAVTTSDQIHIGSCFKMMTATLFGLFVSDHQADWDMPVTELFPDLIDSIAPGWHQRTVAELFYCLGGMMTNPPRKLLVSGHNDDRSLPQQRTSLTRLAFSRPPHKPGRFAYSNMSYIVMGAAIDRLSGVNFESSLKIRILDPLGVCSAGYGAPPDVWGHSPRVFIGGAALFKGKPADPTESKSDNPPVLSSAGTLHINCADWARLLQLFQRDCDPGIVDNDIIERVLHLPQHKGARMSMGWAPASLQGVSFGAQGSNMRWSATALIDDAQRRIAIVVCNDGRSSVLTQSGYLAQQLLQL
ncbi:MAG: serine hydrolase domain-containing protein [Granulosicoccus sp.]